MKAPRLEVEVRWSEKAAVRRAVTDEPATISVGSREVYDLPYILPDKKAVRRVNDGKLGQRLLKLLEPKGMVGLA